MDLSRFQKPSTETGIALLPTNQMRNGFITKKHIGFAHIKNGEKIVKINPAFEKFYVIDGQGNDYGVCTRTELHGHMIGGVMYNCYDYITV